MYKTSFIKAHRTPNKMADMKLLLQASSKCRYLDPADYWNKFVLEMTLDDGRKRAIRMMLKHEKHNDWLADMFPEEFIRVA